MRPARWKHWQWPYYFTGEERYAERAALLVRAWFLDPATRMKPNFRYAQVVMGLDDGRGAGLRHLVNGWTNALKLVHLATPNSALNSPAFGAIRTALPKRQTQLGLRLTF